MPTLVNEADRKRPYKPRVHWTQQEMATFIDAAKKHGAPELGDTEAVFKLAMESLPVERRRPYNSELAGIMNAERRKGGGHYNGIATVEPKQETPKPPPQLSAVPTASLPENVVPIKAPMLASITEQLSAMINEVIMNALYDVNIRKALREIVRDLVTPETQLEQAESVVWREPKTPRERLPRILIVGGNFNLRELFINFTIADLRFWGQEKGDNTHRLISLAQGADYVLVIIHKVGHNAIHALEARNINFERWNRPNTELRPHVMQTVAAFMDERTKAGL